MTRLLATILCLSILAATADAMPTDVLVRVLSKDAKFIGSSMGGVSIVIKDAASGKILAKGKTSGGTGDTKRIMRQPRFRGKTLSTKGAAGYFVTLDLARPTRLLVIAEGPLSNADSANRVTATQWAIPGKHLTGGDGVLLEMPGFSVNARAHTAASDKSKTVKVWAKVTMMCGCPIEPGGLWDANGYEVAAIMTDSDGNSDTIPMRYAGKTSIFSGSGKISGEGPYEALVYVYDSSNGNAGVDIVRFDASE